MISMKFLLTISLEFPIKANPVWATSCFKRPHGHQPNGITIKMNFDQATKCLKHLLLGDHLSAGFLKN